MEPCASPPGATTPVGRCSRSPPTPPPTARRAYACGALPSPTLHADADAPTWVRDIAERTGLPQPYLEQILLALKGAGLVRSKRGVGGGYVLDRDPPAV